MRLLFKPLMAILTFLSVIGSLAAMPQGRTIYVNHTNNKCEDADGTKERPYRTVSEAVARAAPGSRLEVQAGVYNEQVTIPNSLILNSSGGAARIGLRSTRKICQLTGDTDLERCKQPAPNLTNARFKVQGTDLGIPVEHGNRIYFLFGDTIIKDLGIGGQYEPELGRPPSGDSIGYVNLPADPEHCLKLEFIRGSDGGYISAKVHDPDIRLSDLEVPSGAFSANGKMYVFFTTDFIAIPYDGGKEKVEVMGRSVLARWDGNNQNLSDGKQNLFTHLYDFSRRELFDCWPPSGPCPEKSIGKFINVSPVVVNNSDIPGLPQTTGKGVLLWGSGMYHHSNPYLAYLPLDAVEDREKKKLLYWGVEPGGSQPRWVKNEIDAIPLFNRPCIGELSVSWNPFLRKWLMLYNCWDGIQYQVADKPWGPWEERGLLFDAKADGGFCHYIHEPDCDSVFEGDHVNGRGATYGPYVISHFTRGDATTTTIYWTMSTWNPYQVVLMKSILRLSDGRRAD